MEKCNCNYAQIKNTSWHCPVHGQMENSPQSNDWEERFDKKFKYRSSNGGIEILKNDIRVFISHLLASEKSRLVEEVNGMKVEVKHHAGCLNTEYQSECDCTEFYVRGCINKTLDEVLAIISK